MSLKTCMIINMSGRSRGTAARASRVLSTRPMLMRMSSVVEITSIEGADRLQDFMRLTSWTRGRSPPYTAICRQQSSERRAATSKVVTAQMSSAMSLWVKMKSMALAVLAPSLT
jgi:hypothetical protein